MAAHFSTFVVANPAAGAGSVARHWPLIERLLRDRIPALEYTFTEGPGHGTLLAREALRAGWEMIVAVGGDGTLNEVVNGFREQPDPRSCYALDEQGWITRRAAPAPPPLTGAAVLGLLPLGTGSDFRRSIGLAGGLRENIELLAGRETRAIDLGQVGYLNHRGELATRFFINVSSAGFSGRVVHFANRGWKGGGGRLSFILASLRALAGWKNLELEVRLDDVEVHGRMLALVVANGEYFGGGMRIAPGARLDDGQFEVVALGDLPRWQLPELLPGIYRGTHVKNARVTRYQARQVAVRLAAPSTGLIDLDGEQPGFLPAMWNLYPGALRLKASGFRASGDFV